MKILNLYAGIGGNRKLWGDEHDITAVELVPEIAEVYKQFFPNDTVIVGDAHQYLLDHHQEFDFIWSSPPCPTHSVTNHFLKGQGIFRYPDYKLWQEIIFLKHFFKGKYVVENVKSYYEPIYTPQVVGRHYYWANFTIPDKQIDYVQNICKDIIEENWIEYLKFVRDKAIKEKELAEKRIEVLREIDGLQPSVSNLTTAEKTLDNYYYDFSTNGFWNWYIANKIV